MSVPPKTSDRRVSLNKEINLPPSPPVRPTANDHVCLFKQQFAGHSGVAPVVFRHDGQEEEMKLKTLHEAIGEPVRSGCVIREEEARDCYSGLSGHELDVSGAKKNFIRSFGVLHSTRPN